MLSNTKSLRAIFSCLGHLLRPAAAELAVGELGREPPAAHVVRRRDQHDEVEALLEPRLEQQRDLDHDERRPRPRLSLRLDPVGHGLTDERVQQVLEPAQLGLVGEDDAGEAPDG